MNTSIAMSDSLFIKLQSQQISGNIFAFLKQETNPKIFLLKMNIVMVGLLSLFLDMFQTILGIFADYIEYSMLFTSVLIMIGAIGKKYVDCRYLSLALCPLVMILFPPSSVMSLNIMAVIVMASCFLFGVIAFSIYCTATTTTATAMQTSK